MSVGAALTVLSVSECVCKWQRLLRTVPLPHWPIIVNAEAFSRLSKEACKA